MDDKVRVLRIIEYVGDRAWVEQTLLKSAVPLNGVWVINKECCIKSALIDQFPEVLEKETDQ